MAPLVASGQTRCCRCGKLTEAGEAWHLDHADDDRRRYLGVAHAICNLRAAGSKSHQQRSSTRELRWSRIWFEPVPPGTRIGSIVYDDNGQPT
jgi:hypothetical protein